MLEDLTDPSAKISEGDGNIEEDTAAANVQRSGQLERGISSAVLDEEEQLSPIVSTGPPQKPTQTAGCAVDSMAARTGLPILCRLDPRRLVDAPELQALLEDLTDPSATISEGDGNSEEDTAAANFQRTGHLARGISSAAMDEEAQFSAVDRRCRQQGGNQLPDCHPFWHIWPASKLAILRSLTRVYWRLQSVSIGLNGTFLHADGMRRWVLYT